MKAFASCAAVVVLAFPLFQAPARESVHPALTHSGVIRGRVLTEDGAPIRKARVGLAEMGHDEGWPAFTGADGRFQFSGLDAGRYILTVSKAGYVTTRYGARHPLEPPAPIAVSGDSVLEDLEIRLVKGAAINGRVIDDDGDPVISAPVSAARAIRSGSEVRLSTVRTTNTDDLGEYRLRELPAGAYVVTVDPSQSMSTPQSTTIIVDEAGRMRSMDQPWSHWQRVYYPASTTPGQAQPLALAPGQEVTSIDFTVAPHSTGRATITVASPGGAAVNGMVQAISDSPIEPLRHFFPFTTGEAAVTPLEPGEWDVFAEAGAAGSARTHVSVGESDVAINLALAPDVRIAGRLLVDGAPPAAGTRLMLDALPVLSSNGAATPPPGIISASLRLGHTDFVNPDGSFSIEAMRGRTRLVLRLAPAGSWLESITAAGRSTTDDTIDVADADAVSNVVVRINTRRAEVSGIVRTASGAPAPGVSVLVFPANAAWLANPDRATRWLKTDERGRFVSSDLPGGDYFAIATTDVDDAQWSAPDYLEPLRARAVSFSVAAGDKKAVNLTIGSGQ